MIRHYTLTLTGAIQRLSTALSLTSELDVPIKSIVLQPNGANAGVIYIGGSAVSASSYGVRLEAGAAGVPPAPFIMGEVSNSIGRLSELYVLGTNTEKLHISLIT